MNHRLEKIKQYLKDNNPKAALQLTEDAINFSHNQLGRPLINNIGCLEELAAHARVKQLRSISGLFATNIYNTHYLNHFKG